MYMSIIRNLVLAVADMKIFARIAVFGTDMVPNFIYL